MEYYSDESDYYSDPDLKLDLSKPPDADVEDEEVADEQFGVADTYADYMPAKLQIGQKHPDPVVETASLSSIPPPNITYTLSIPETTIQTGKLSALQLESITYTAQAHEKMLPDGSRAGFLIGDGAGVGKGRTIAGIIWENFLKGRTRAIWVSVSNDLKYDSERDLHDIGVKNNEIPVYQLSKLKYAQISSVVNGSIRQGVIFSTYSALISMTGASSSSFKSRLEQLIEWCGEDFDGPIVFDECHRAKNLCPDKGSKSTKTGITVLELQKRLPLARVVYASATGASEPRNMAYMTRLGLWGKTTPFRKFDEFLQAIDRRGVGAKEIVAMDMKLRGMYIARQLSFQGVTFTVDEVPITKEFERAYDASVELWVEAMNKFQAASKLLMEDPRIAKMTWRQFWAAHQRFFKYLCIGTKVQRAVAIAQEAIANDKCVVIGLQFTGEARTLDELERNDGELTDFVSTAKGVLQTLVEKHFPTLENVKRRMEALNKRKRNTDSNPGKSKNEPAFKRIKKEKENEVVDTLLGMFDGPFDDSDSDGETKNLELLEHKWKRQKRAPRRGSKKGIFHFWKDTSFDGDSVANSDMYNSPSTSRGRGQGRGRGRGSKTPAQAPSRQKRTPQKPSNKINKPGSSDYIPTFSKSVTPSKKSIDLATAMRQELLEKIEELGHQLPLNTLDELINKLGGPAYVAEMTGRKGRVVQTFKNRVDYETRGDSDVPLEMANLAEKQRFMDGEKLIAIISEAASSGISLQSDRKVANKRRRVHITLELPWSADKAIQQFGRTHRSNQVNAPEYIFLISDLAGERRFASVVAKRLESLGALTHGDRRAAQTTNFTQFNIDNKYGRKALEVVMKAMIGEPVTDVPKVPLPDDYDGPFFKDVTQALVGVGLMEYEEMIDDYTLPNNFTFIPRFLNRILGMPVRLQNRLFQYFCDTLDAIVAQAKMTGRFDHGILDLGTENQIVNLVSSERVPIKNATGETSIDIHTVNVVSGMSWEEAMAKYSQFKGEYDGFWLSYQIKCNKRTATLVRAIPTNKINPQFQMFCLYRPNSGLIFRSESLADLERKNRKVEPAEAEKAWTEQYDSSLNTCWHAFWDDNCKNAVIGIDCEVGRRKKGYAIVSGSVLSVWGKLESVIVNKMGKKNEHMQVIRLKTVDDMKIIGVLIDKNVVGEFLESLSREQKKFDIYNTIKKEQV